MKKKFFDKGLMVDGLSQLKLSGIIFLIISVAGTVLPAIFNWFNLKNQEKAGQSIAQINAIQSISISEVAGILIPVMYIAPFVFCLVLFAFLNSRKDSDFFHALPKTRVCLFMSYTVSIIVWLAVIIILPILAASLIYAISDTFFNAVFIPYLIFTFLAGAVLVLACMLFAMSITGTVLTNIIVFGLILFLPSLITSFYTSVVSQLLPILDPTKIAGIANINYNIPSKFIVGLAHIFNLGVATGDTLYISVSAIIFTFVLAVIYLCIGCLLFHFRKSEAAGSSAPSNVLQHVYRCAITLPVTLFIPSIIIPYIANQSADNDFWMLNSSNIITAIVISLIVYYLFEIITTKKPKNLLKATPFLLVFVIIDAIFGFSVISIRNNVLNFKPTSNDIQNVTFSPYNFNDYYNNTQENSYNDLLVKNLRFSDTSILNEVVQTLDENIDALKSSGNNINSNNSLYEVRIYLKNGKSLLRIIHCSNNMSSEMDDSMQKNSEYFNCSVSLPPKTSIKQKTTTSNQFNEAETEKLWDSFQSEYNTLSYNDKLELSSMYHASGNSMYGGALNEQNFDTIEIQGRIGSQDYVSLYPITSITPTTALLYFKMTSKKENAISIMTADLNKSNVTDTCNVNLYNAPAVNNSQNSQLAYINMQQASSQQMDDGKKLINLLLQQADEPIDFSKPYVMVDIYTNNGKYSYTYYQPLSDESINEIQGMNLSVY
jgi:ABC-2 type transport system permease protein